CVQRQHTIRALSSVENSALSGRCPSVLDGLGQCWSALISGGRPRSVPWPASVSAVRFGSVLFVHHLLVDELVHRQRSQLASDAGALDSAEGQIFAGALGRVEEDHAGIDLGPDTFGSLDI